MCVPIEFRTVHVWKGVEYVGNTSVPVLPSHNTIMGYHATEGVAVIPKFEFGFAHFEYLVHPHII